MGIVPYGFVIRIEQKLVATCVFPELARYAIPLYMEGQIKYSEKINDHVCGYIDVCGRQEKLPNLGRKCKAQHFFSTSNLLLSGSGLDLIRGAKSLCQCLGELEVAAKQLWVFRLEFRLRFPLHPLLLLAKSIQLCQIPLGIEIAGLKYHATFFQNGGSSLLTGKHRNPMEIMLAGCQIQKFSPVEQGLQFRHMLVPPALPAFGGAVLRLSPGVLLSMSLYP